METQHANCLKLEDCGLLIVGDSGSGKSAITLALIERARQNGRQAVLVSDDYTQITREGDYLIARSPQNLCGGIEIIGAGLFKLPVIEYATLSHVVRLGKDYERFPSDPLYSCCGVDLPMRRLAALGIWDAVVICQAIEAFLFGSIWQPRR